MRWLLCAFLVGCSQQPVIQTVEVKIPVPIPCVNQADIPAKPDIMLDQTLLLLPPEWRPEHLLGVYIPGLGVLLTAVVGIFRHAGTLASRTRGSPVGLSATGRGAVW